MATGTIRAGTPAEASGRPVRVRRGEQPTPSSLGAFQRWAWKTFGARVSAKPPNLVLEENLVKAHMRVRADEYLATVYATAVVVGIATTVIGVALGGLLFVSGLTIVLRPGGISIALKPLAEIGLALFFLPVVATPGSYFLLLGMPGSNAKARGHKIDRKIGPAMSFVSAMASADVNIDQIFKELGRQKIYGEVAEEAAWITRDTELLGVDILTAIRRGAQRTPSKKFQDFLQGVVTTATSGGQLKPYFLLKAEQYEREHKLEIQQRVETMGLMAETFVTVVVAFPLFLVIIIAIFAIIGGGGQSMVTILWGIVLGMIPVSQFAFIFFMYSLAQEMV